MSNQPIYDSQGIPRYPTTVTLEELAQGRQAEADRIRKVVADHERQVAEAQAEQRRAEREQGTAALEAFRERAAAAWVSNGGSAAAFGDAWPRLRETYLLERTSEALTHHERLVEQTKAEMRASGRYAKF